jgi:hypothetical protein
MEETLDQIGKRSLKQLTLPASHDAAMYLTGFPQSLGRTQNLSIYGQLNEGIRYFDLRPAWREGEIFMHHDFIMGPKLDVVLGDVQRFMSENHCELVILKFSHYDAIDDAHYSTMVQQIQTKLAPWLWTTPVTNQRLADIALKTYLRSHGTVLILCDGSQPLAHPMPGIWIYRDWDSRNPAPGDLRVYDQYANTTSYGEMKSDQFKKFELYNGRCKSKPDVPCDLFLLSWTLTPTTNVPAYAKEPNQRLANDINELKIPNEFGCVVNLLYADCVETAKLTEIAIQLNKQRNEQSRGVSPRSSN